MNDLEKIQNLIDEILNLQKTIESAAPFQRLLIENKEINPRLVELGLLLVNNRHIIKDWS